MNPNSRPSFLDSPYEAYLYSYPHKTSYRPFEPPIALERLWEREKRDALSLYIHVPFCELRCGYCNLFSSPKPTRETVEAYAAALERQARRVRAAIPGAAFARLAIGGGTPTHLDAASLERVLDVAEKIMGAQASRIPCSVEVSPASCGAEKLRLLRERRVSRISIGVQSFIDAELEAVHRPQRAEDVNRALASIRALAFPVLNVDLIYGLPGQTAESLIRSLEAALRFSPEELYLYPLYVRPRTGLGKSRLRWGDHRTALYASARDWLLERGYRQLSMRMFRAAKAPDLTGPVYRCQEDGMIGLGPGARSYTVDVHYATPFAVGAKRVRELIGHYLESSESDFGFARNGIRLDAEDQRRRFVILSLLAEGLDFERYRQRFGSDAREDLPQLAELVNADLVIVDGGGMRLSAEGVTRSDAIGPWLRSAKVRQLMEAYELQ